jgi:hypothetical protein
MGEAVEFFHANGYANGYSNGFSKNCEETNQLDNIIACSWYEEQIDDDLKWSFALKRFVQNLRPSTNLSK